MRNKLYVFCLIIATGIGVSWVFARPFRLLGDCMEPAVKDGQLCFLNQILPYIRSYKIGDVVLFTHEEKVWVSRIVALENNTVELINGKLAVDDVTLQDSVKRDWTNWKYGTYAVEKSFKVPPGYVYVLSDKLSAHHDDSRVFGPVSEESILGLVWLLI